MTARMARKIGLCHLFMEQYFSLQVAIGLVLVDLLCA